MSLPERRHVNIASIGAWLAVILGIVTVITTAMVVGSMWGKSTQADSDRDRRIGVLETKVEVLEQSHDKNHPDDTPLVTPKKE